MPWKNPKQPIAIFLDIQRKRGQDAAEQFARKHRSEMSKGAKAAAKDRGARPYSARRRRSA